MPNSGHTKVVGSCLNNLCKRASFAEKVQKITACYFCNPAEVC
ncbi:hypothetical protein F542_3760 [Bibersteinia trehalosi USDA-ARS-USMARC-188]|uniref:Uncharacterized protein n=3 Tax=Bibersteinia trehalosi TaxID=47735 RepID=W0R9U6_BIBTR|nr:hypothetical protein WQG_18820 [Bibersteinia trehalosi USDA-ARS-USMARC-192]AHG81094.1 hypothetical protein F542_3760 [Bibersteinia trehalosi USDA-ARS-USMARC-188]AHG83305.1 hypothetical protein F543_4410 [Bibersteinia trehalosi USDA-ARS-USMARC-189]AHG87090.1 hypothetical protein F544_18620 [Bibersteinia trehalosi USDA-ARS-USMARC-190]